MSKVLWKISPINTKILERAKYYFWKLFGHGVSKFKFEHDIDRIVFFSLIPGCKDSEFLVTFWMTIIIICKNVCNISILM